MLGWIEFVSHCEPDCGLGSAWYICPHCQKRVVDYDLWYDYQERYTEDLNFKCENCEKELVAEYQISEGVYEVRV